MQKPNASSWKTLALPILAASALMLNSVAARVPAPPKPVPSITTYYSDHTLSNNVGAEIVTCDGMQYFLYGQPSPYKTVELLYCPPIPVE